ncbi:MAG: hypothetical protein EPN79_11260 [Burkholderiaceae bacterium]|nr:MAG: hypothetical protein EPN79_11260 [Burkholderiaceae bacterium]TBR76739.1 MAG: hypothetical protein EPN64_05815 [Burkholderiaceae bacterium]
MNNWPRTGRSYKIPGTPLPPQAGAPLVLILFHLSLLTLGLALAVCAVFSYASFKNRTILWAARRIRSKLRGGVIAARPRLYRRRFTMNEQLSDIDFNHWGKDQP